MEIQLEAGDRFAERFLIQGLLGSGGMGSVFLAEHEVLGRRVALKVIRPRLLTDPQMMGRFQREARAASRTASPHIVRIYDSGFSAEGLPYIAMEYVEGPTLLATLVSEGPMPALRALYILIQIGEALHVAHAADVVHRDLKPGNIVLTEQQGEPDFVKILDFGLAKITGADATANLSAEGFVLGTPHYISPEQVSGAPSDHRVDLYSLGVVAYEMLTCTLPFEGTSMEVMAAHLIRTPQAPSAAVPRQEIPPALDRLVLRCLAKQPEDRFASATALLQELSAIQTALTPQAITLVDGGDLLKP